MRNPLPIAILLCIATALPAQNIPIVLSKKASQPAAFELPGRNAAVLLFYHLRNGRLVVQGREINASFELLRQTEQPELASNLGSIDYVCGAVSGNVINTFFIVDGSKIWRIQLHLDDFSLEHQEVQSFREFEECLGGFTQQGKFYLITRRLEAKNKGLLSIYENPGMADAQAHFVDLEGPIRLTAKKYQPYWLEPTIELAPEIVSGPDKIYFDSTRIWFSSDINLKSSSGGAPAIELSTLSLQDYSLKTEQITFDMVPGTNLDKKQKATHCILDNQLFTLFYDKEFLQLCVQDLSSRQVLWQETIRATKDTITLFNSPLILPGKNTFSTEKEYFTGKKFIPRFLGLDPFLQVRYDSVGYILSLGGFLPPKNSGGLVYVPGSPGFNTPYGKVSGTTGSWTTGSWGNWAGWGGSQGSSANFYVILQRPNPAVGEPLSEGLPANFSVPNLMLTNTFLGKISNFFGSAHDVADGIFYLFGKHYYGRYQRDDKVYQFKYMILREQK